MPGYQKELISYFEKKGFRIEPCNSCSKEVLLMKGVIGGSYNNFEYMIRIQKVKDNPTSIQSITLLYPKNPDSLISQMKHYQKCFYNSFGMPSQEDSSFSKWIFLKYIYTIGYEGTRIYHKLEMNKFSNHDEIVGHRDIY